MSTTQPDRGRLYTGLSGVLGPDVAGDLLNAIPDTSNVATKDDLARAVVELRAEMGKLRDKLDERFDKLHARFDRLWYSTLILLAAVVGWLFSTAG